MSVSEIRQQLHKAIDEIENKEILQRMLNILEQSHFQSANYQLTGEQLSILAEREGKYVKDNSQSQTLDEFRMKMNKKHGL